MKPTITITGTRKYPRLDLVAKIVEELLPPQCNIITGNTQGVETTVIQRTCWPDKPLHQLTVIPTNWTQYRKAAIHIKNLEMLSRSQILIAFTHNNQLEELICEANRRNILVYEYDKTGHLKQDQPFLFQPDHSLYLPDMSGHEFNPDTEGAILNRYL